MSLEDEIIKTLEDLAKKKPLEFGDSKKLKKGSNVIVAADDYWEKTEGADVEDKFQKSAKEYLEGVGLKGDGSKEFYGNQMRQILDKEYDKAIQAIKDGDANALASIYHETYLRNLQNQKVSPVLSKMQQLKSDHQVNLAKKLAKVLGGKDYLKVVKDPAGTYNDLTVKAQMDKKYAA